MARAAFGSPMASLRQRIVAIQLLVTVLGVLSLVIPATSFAVELAALQRVVDDTRDVAAEVTKAVQRVERKNATRRDSLSAEARHSGAADISAPMLRAAGLEVDAARSQVRTTADRIERRETEIYLLDQQLERQAATQRADAEEAPAAEVAQPGPLGELRAVSAELLEALQRLADAEAEQLVLAEERLALLQSRVELGAIRDLGAFEEDPRVTALRAIVSRQTRDGTRLANEAAAIEPESVASSEQKQLLALQAHDAVARATQRLIDLDLLSIQGQIGFLDELAGNRAVPVRVLRDGRSELDVLRGRLEAQLQELTEERLALTDQRKLIGGQGGEASELVEAQLALVGNLEELLDFQQADIGKLQQQIAESAALLDAEIGGRELSAFAERRPLLLGPHHRDLLGSELALLPETILERGREFADTVEARLAWPSRSLAALVAGALAAIGVALWWLYRRGLRNLVSLDPNGLSSVPIEAFRRTLPTFLPVFAWLAVAFLADLDPQSMWLIAATLALWPAVCLLLHTHDLLAAHAGRAPDAHRSGRSVLIAAACIGAIVLVVHAAPTLPSLGYVADRFAFIGVALAAIGTWTLRGSLLAALRTRSQMSPAWLRFLEVVTVAVPGLLALAAVGGLAGWVDLGWTIAGGIGGVMVAIGLVAGVACVLGTITQPMRAQMGTRRNMAAFDATLRLTLIGLAIGAAWYLVATYTESAAVAASFWVLAIAVALPFVLQPIEALVELLLRIDRDRQEDGAVSVLAICVDRGVRALLIVGAALGLASLLDFDLAALASGDTLQAKIVRAAFNIALVAFLADFVWQLAKTMIDQRLAIEGGGEEAEPSEAGGEGGGQGASRLRTLLPLLRKFLMITLAVIVVMLVLSSLGVNIGPLLAGAGVVGLAIGFGAQTLVRDIVSGVFFLMDDAFRLGEYVDVGEVKGTVENISVRSLRLRHHRGALHTIPFGEITHLSNYSRDWVIMKLEFRVPFDTDMQQVKKIFKRIGAEMMADEELGSNLLDPPKSQGVFQMDDSAMIVRAKFMAKPGKQFVIRRELYHRVQKEFDAAGIEFARRQVSVFVPPGVDPETADLAVQAAAAEEPAESKKGVHVA